MTDRRRAEIALSYGHARATQLGQTAQQIDPERLLAKVAARENEPAGLRCYHCGVELDASKVRVDHSFPLIAGGEHTLENIEPVCENDDLGELTGGSTHPALRDFEEMRRAAPLFESLRWEADRAPYAFRTTLRNAVRSPRLPSEVGAPEPPDWVVERLLDRLDPYVPVNVDDLAKGTSRSGSLRTNHWNHLMAVYWKEGGPAGALATRRAPHPIYVPCRPMTADGRWGTPSFRLRFEISKERAHEYLDDPGAWQLEVPDFPGPDRAESTPGRLRAAAGVRRSNDVKPTEVSTLDQLRNRFSDESRLKAFARATAAAIEAAHEVNPEGWTLNRRSAGPALTVGPNHSVRIEDGRVGLISSGSPDELKEILAEDARSAKLYNAPDNACLIELADDNTSAALSRLGDRHLDAVRRSATSNCPVRRYFSEDLLHAIEELTGRELPRPSLPHTPGRQPAWVVRMKRDGTREVVDAVTRGDARIFWTIDVDPGSSLSDVRTALAEQDPELSAYQVGNAAGQIHRFISKMNIGDLILSPDGDDLYVGEITSGARYDAAGEWIRDVNWLNADEPAQRSDVSSALYSRLRTLLTVTDVADLAGELVRLVSGDALPEEAGESAATPVGPPTLRPVTDELAADLFVERAWLREIVDVLERKRQLIFYGPPGTGKTFIAKQLAEHLTSDARAVQLVQFHPSYSYEDFIEGYRPVVEKGVMSYELRPGPLKEMADLARDNPGEVHVLIIDEINRGNMAKIFGELYFLLEYRDEEISLQYGSAADRFSIPENLYLIGTMNTADRSIALVDAAIRRRFGFSEFNPIDGGVAGTLRGWLADRGRDDLPARLLDELNRRLGDRDLAVGPSYLMTPESATIDGLRRIWRYEIEPLLAEHFYGRPEALEPFTLESLMPAVQPVAIEAEDEGDPVDG